jgi:hypothetical protein
MLCSAILDFKVARLLKGSAFLKALLAGLKGKVFLAFLFLALAFSARAQLSVGITGSPGMVNIHNQAIDHFEPIFALHYGLNLAFQTRRWRFSTGLRHLTQGGKSEVLETSETNPQGSGETFDVYLRTRAIALPLEGNYHFIQKDKSSIFVGMGVYVGYFYAQRQENTNIPKGGNPNTIINNPPTRFTDVNLFEDLYLGLNLGLGWDRQLTEHLTLRVRPNFLYQLRTENKTSNNAGASRLMTYALEIGLSYTIQNHSRGLY